MNKSPKFSPEVRERAVRMVQEHRADYPSLWAAIESIAPKIGCVPQTLNDWVKKAEVDSGQRIRPADCVAGNPVMVSQTHRRFSPFCSFFYSVDYGHSGASRMERLPTSTSGHGWS